MSRNTKEEIASKRFAENRKKCVFEFFDGTRMRKVDLWKALLAVQAEIPLQLAHANSGTGKDVSDLVAVFRKVLGIPEWSEENQDGLTDGEALEIVTEFMEFAEGEKKNTKRSVISPPSTAAESLTEPKQSNADCGST